MRWPWDQVELEPHEISAIKAISAATFAVIEKLCSADRNPFRDGGEDGRRATDFACGKLSLANVLRALRDMKMPGPATPPSRQGPPEEPQG